MPSKKSNDRDKIDIIILMAGEGRRLLPLTSDRPKALLHFNDGISIFEHTIRAFVTENLNATIIPVIGHGRVKVLEEVSRLSNMAHFYCATNPFYLTAGPLVSLWVGLMQSTSEQVLILNGDTVIKEALVKNIKKWLQLEINDHQPQAGICITKTNDLKIDDMKILVEDGCFVRAGKDISPDSSVMKSAGVMCIKTSCGKNLLKEKLDLLLMDEKYLKTNYYWHNILNEIKKIFSIDLIYVNADSWHEIDTEEDLKLMNNNYNR